MLRIFQRCLRAATLSMFVGAVIAPGPIYAQNVGTISGVVKDSQGLAIPGASVSLKNRVSRIDQMTVSDEQGRYALNNVAYGTYVLTAALQGFRTADQVVEVRSSVPLLRDIALAVGGVSEAITVSADALLETSSTGSHVDLGATLIDQMPTATPSKQVSAMLLSAPGFIPSQNGRVHVRGSHGQIQYVVDGVPLTDEFSEAYANPLDPQYVKSAEVITGGIPAEYGGKLAAVVDITSKSGLDDPQRFSGQASLNVGQFGSVDGGGTLGGRLGSRVGYFVSFGGNRTDRYLDPPTSDNLHNTGEAGRFTGKVELRPTDRDLVRAVVSVNGSQFDVPNRPDAQATGVDATQELSDNSQTVTWLHQFADHLTLNVIGYRRAATATLDALTATPLASEQDRSLDHQGGSLALSYATGGHHVKAGVQYDRNPLTEHFAMQGDGTADPEFAQFDPSLGGTPFVFDGHAVGETLGLFLQDTFSPVPDLHLNVGVRFDRYQLLITDTAVSPRLGIAYHLHNSGTVLRGSYSRIFMPPFAENLLLSSSPEARAISPNEDIGGGTDVQAERQHAFEVGIQQALRTHAKLDVAYYRKNMRDVADVEQFLDTTVTFPISVAKGVAQGVEARLDVPLYRQVSGYVSLSRASILLTAPLTGGLFLEDVPEPGEEFYADHDQRWQSQFGLSYEHPRRRLFASLTGRFDSGIPFELPEDFDPATFEDPQALTLINLDTGRAKPRTIINALVGSELYRRGRTRLDGQFGMLNVFNTTYLLNFLSIFNGTHYGAPRTWTARLKMTF